MTTRSLTFRSALAIAPILLACAVSAQAATSVALVLPGSIADGGWNAGAYAGLKALEAGGDFEVSFSENVGQADIPTVVQGYADDGTDLIVGHGFQFGSLFAEIAPEYPEQAFFATTTAPGDIEVPDNALYVDFQYGGAAYGAGVLAALMSGGEAVGMVGGGDNPTTQQMSADFTRAAEATVPGLKAYSIVTGDYNDAAKGREAAATMIGNGADVIWHTADITGIGAIQGASSGGAEAIGMFSDQMALAPEAIGTSFSANNGGLVETVGRSVADGTFKGGRTWTPDLDFVWITRYGDDTHNPALVADDVWSRFETTWNGIASGEVDILSE